MNDDGSIPIQVLNSVASDLPLQIILIVVLILLNAFFAGSEIALLSFNEAKMKKSAEDGNKKARSVLKFVENSSKFLSTIQVGVTLAGFLSSAFAADSFADLIMESLSGKTAIPDNIFRTLIVVLITFVLSFFTLVFGELVPKKIGMKYSDKFAKTAVGPLKFISVLFAPFIWLLTVTVNGVLRLFGINPKEEEEDVTEEEIMLMVNEGQEQGVIGNEESEMISNVLEFNDKTANDIMTHRTEVIAVENNATLEELIELATTERFSRFPVFKDSIDNVIGVIHIKDLLRYRNTDSFRIEDIMREPCFIPGSQKIDDVFKDLKEEKNHMGIVLDEYGGTAGIITMEDILEELVGNIMDEYDDEEEEISMITKTGENTYLVDGLTELDQVNDELEIELPKEDYDIVSGFVIGELGYIPEENECPSFDYDNVTVNVISHNNKIITQVEIVVHEKTKNNDEDKDEDSDKD